MALSLRTLLVAAGASVVAKSITVIDPTTSASTNNKEFATDAVKLNAQPNDAVEVATVGLTTVTIFASSDSFALVFTVDSTSPAEAFSSVSFLATAPTIANVTASPVPTAPLNTTVIPSAANNGSNSPPPVSKPAPTPVGPDAAPEPKPDDSKPDSPDNKKSGAGQLASSLKQALFATILVGVLLSLAM